VCPPYESPQRQLEDRPVLILTFEILAHSIYVIHKLKEHSIAFAQKLLIKQTDMPIMEKPQLIKIYCLSLFSPLRG